MSVRAPATGAAAPSGTPSETLSGAPSTAPAADAPRSGRHLHEIDLFRVVTFAAVVAVHTVARGSNGGTYRANLVEILLHYTREAFFFLTGLVLAHSAGDRPLRLRRFLPRRLRLVVIPYVVWSFLFVAYVHRHDGLTVTQYLQRVRYDLPRGLANYHLYFLLVSMQVYLLFPLLHRLRRVGREHPWALLLPVAVAQLAFLTALYVHTDTTDGFGWLDKWAYVTVLPYPLWVLGGCVVGWNLSRIEAFLVRRWRWLLPAGLLAVAPTLGSYALVVGLGRKPQDAADVLQPVMVLWASAAICLQALLSLAWARRRREGSRAARVVAWCSSASFGVFLLHPLVLDRFAVANWLGGPASPLPQPWADLLAWALVLAISTGIVAVLRHTPLSLPLTGRPHRGRRARRRARAAAVASPAGPAAG